MDGFLFRVPASAFEELVARNAADPSHLDDFLFAPESGLVHTDDVLELHGDWHALHTLLTGSHELSEEAVEAIESPLKFLLGGGVRLDAGDSICQGIPNTLARSALEALEDETPARLASRWDEDVMSREVSPSNSWTNETSGDWSLGWLQSHTLPRLQAFVRSAVERGMPLISFVSV